MSTILVPQAHCIGGLLASFSFMPRLAKKPRSRTERDSLGSTELAQGPPYGIEAERDQRCFFISGRLAPLRLTGALIRIKRAAARANYQCGSLDSGISSSICKACDELLDIAAREPARLQDLFPLDVFGAGAGTSLHMNVNEVIAIRASRPGAVVDPHAHVNLHQSSNDVLPTAIRLSLVEASFELLRATQRLEEGLQLKAFEARDIRKTARTHLRDAVPITLGREIHAWAVSLGRCREWLGSSLGELSVLPLGGGVLGTALGIPKKFAEFALAELKGHYGAFLGVTGKTLSMPTDRVEAVQSQAPVCLQISMLRLLAIELWRISGDLRLLSSGPRAGLAEILLPSVQHGSGAMPGNADPSIPEMVGQVCLSVMGQDMTCALAASNGQLDLNVMTPVLGCSALEATEMLARAVDTLQQRCISGLEFNRSLMAENYRKNSALIMALSATLGFLKAGEWIRRAEQQDKPVLDWIREQGLSSEDLKKLEVALEESLSWPFADPWAGESGAPAAAWDSVDQASWESFPASDSPAW